MIQAIKSYISIIRFLQIITWAFWELIWFLKKEQII